MKLFRRRNASHGNQGQVYWRNADGKVACPGDSCVEQCENGCPIHYATLGLERFQMGNTERAISLLQQSVRIAPDFDEAWNNLGACYGSLSRYADSLDAYQKANQLSPQKKRPIYGMALAYRDLGSIKEAIQCCDMYDAIANDGALNNVRSELQKLKNAGDDLHQQNDPSSDIIQAQSIMKDFISCGQKEGYLTSINHFNFIPEILSDAQEVVKRLWIDLWKSLDEDGVKDAIQRYSITLRFCACAGMGAVMHWHLDWPELNRKGVYETLTGPRGLFAMDEYVTDLVGIKWGTPESDQLVSHLHSLIQHTAQYFSLHSDNPQKGALQYMECFKAAYLYGMMLQMHRLGMN